jgi:uncharacterized surface protein with fasciclin (FAS1) repeats
MSVATLIATCGLLVTPSAQAVDGTTSLASVLTAKSSFDTVGSNYDIVTAAVLLPVQLLPLGTKSLASVLTAKNSFDSNKNNFDIVTAAVLAVLKAKPASAVKVLTEGGSAVTAFIPTDRAFFTLVRGLTGKTPKIEAAAFAAVAGLGIPAVEEILLYHVIPGDAILSPAALKANGVTLKTALAGKTIKVGVRGTRITLTDYNKKLANPSVILTGVDINKGNKQIAHAINYVLIPNS